MKHPQISSSRIRRLRFSTYRIEMIGGVPGANLPARHSLQQGLDEERANERSASELRVRSSERARVKTSRSRRTTRSSLGGSSSLCPAVDSALTGGEDDFKRAAFPTGQARELTQSLEGDTAPTKPIIWRAQRENSVSVESPPERKLAHRYGWLPDEDRRQRERERQIQVTVQRLMRLEIPDRSPDH